MVAPVQSGDPVIISYADFNTGADFTTAISQAFGKDGLGLIVVKDFPDFQKEREAALRAVRDFANLPEEVKERYTDPVSNYRYAVGRQPPPLHDTQIK